MQRVQLTILTIIMIIIMMIMMMIIIIIIGDATAGTVLPVQGSARFRVSLAPRITAALFCSVSVPFATLCLWYQSLPLSYTRLYLSAIRLDSTIS